MPDLARGRAPYPAGLRDRALTDPLLWTIWDAISDAVVQSGDTGPRRVLQVAPDFDRDLVGAAVDLTRVWPPTPGKLRSVPEGSCAAVYFHYAAVGGLTVVEQELWARRLLRPGGVAISYELAGGRTAVLRHALAALEVPLPRREEYQRLYTPPLWQPLLLHERRAQRQPVAPFARELGVDPSRIITGIFEQQRYRLSAAPEGLVFEPLQLCSIAARHSDDGARSAARRIATWWSWLLRARQERASAA